MCGTAEFTEPYVSLSQRLLDAPSVKPPSPEQIEGGLGLGAKSSAIWTVYIWPKKT